MTTPPYPSNVTALSVTTTVAREWLKQAANDETNAGARTLVGDLLAQIDHLTNRLIMERAHDPVTGAWSSAACEALFEQLQSRAQRDGRPYGVMKVSVQVPNLDDPELAATLRDSAMPAICVRLMDALRGGDVIGRDGRMGFLCLLENCNLDAGQLVAERCRHAVAALPVRVELEGAAVTLLSATIGLVMVAAHADLSTAELLQRADRALLDARQLANGGLMVMMAN